MRGTARAWVGIGVVASLVLAPSLVTAEDDVADQLRRMNDRLTDLEDRLQATNDDLESANSQVEQQQQVIEDAGLSERDSKSAIDDSGEVSWPAGSVLDTRTTRATTADLAGAGLIALLGTERDRRRPLAPGCDR